MAKLVFRFGAMNCGKSSHLMQTAYNYNENNMDVCVIKSCIDTKDDDCISSRIGVRRKVDILLGKDESLIKYYDEWNNNISCILVDEAQFLNTLQVEELWYVAKILDIDVICYGIRTDFLTNSFEGSRRLLELADDLEELNNLCSCGANAKFNLRYYNGHIQRMGDSVLIDGSNENVVYKPVCGKCYIKKTR